MKIDLKILHSYTRFFNVLYVEDDKDVRKSSQKFFDSYFNHLDIAVDGMEGLEKYKSFKETHGKYYDLVITDIQMPKMDGLSMSEKIFEIEPMQSVIIITAHNDNSYLQNAIDIGITGFASKPINKDKFNKTLFKTTQTITNKLQNEEYINNIEKLNLELDEKNLRLEEQKYVEEKNTLLKVEEIRQAFNSHSIIAVTDTKGNILSVNDKFSEISGYPKEELLGSNHRILNSGTHPKEFWVNMYNTISSGKSWTQEVCNTAKNGNYYWVDTTIVPFYNGNNKIENYVAIRTDITNTKELEFSLIKAKEIAEESIKAKSNFLASMSHEIRTPLNAILGFVTILKKQIKDEKATKHLNIIDSSGQSLLKIINDVLDFSKIQSGNFNIDKHDVAIIKELTQVISLFSSKTYDKNLVYVVYIDPNLPEIMHLDIIRINQIISNLLSNAIKFTPMHGEVNVSVTYENSNLVISVKDSGIGISKQNQKKIFEEFQQTDVSTTRKYGGTGLGLAISLNLAKLMNATLHVESEENRGALFTLTIPVKIVKESPLEIINKDKFLHLRYAILSNCAECKSNAKLIKRYLEDFGVTSILELDSYEKDGYDILFFIPDDDFNEDIVNSSTPAIALLRSSTIQLANLKYIIPLYAPFVPTSIIEALNETNIGSMKVIYTNEISEDEELELEGHVLIVEDNKTNQMLIKLLLMDYGITFKIANDGLEGVEMFKNEKFDLVLMDENMPNLNGIGAMKQIKEYENNNCLVLTPIVALTANALDTDRKRFLEAGMDGFIAKPIDTNELELVLIKYLHTKNRRKQ